MLYEVITALKGWAIERASASAAKAAAMAECKAEDCYVVVTLQGSYNFV